MPLKRIKKFILNNSLINIYLDNSAQKTAKQRKLRILLIFNYIIIIFKYVLSLFIGFNNETNLLLYDLSILLGGIPDFNKVFIICIFVFGLCLRLKFDLAQGMDVIIQTFDLINDRKRVLYDYNDIEIVDKINKFSKIIYKLFYTSVITFGETLVIAYQY